MGVVLFFGISFLLVTVGFIYVGLTIRHHWRLDKQKKLENLK